jgi:drug/metabolite transporter (DMT)-like permease
MTKQFKADLALLFVTIGWGTSFLLSKNALTHLETYNFLTLRFFIAFVFSAAIFRKQLFKTNVKTIKYGIFTGIILFLAYALQTVGLQYTTASKSAFITGFSVVLVPLFSALLLKNNLNLRTCISVATAFTGLAFLTLNNSISSINPGDLLTLVSAMIYSIYIILAGKFTLEVESISFAIIQMGAVCVLSFFTALSIEKLTVTADLKSWVSILILSIVCTSCAFIIQMIAQKYTSPTHTALILAGEPVFAGIFGYIFVHETLGIKGFIGAIMILGGMLISEVDFKQILKNLRSKPTLDF